MKRIVSLLLLLLPFGVLAQLNKPIAGFYGLSFGSKKDSVISALKARGAVNIDSVNADFISFTGMKFGNREGDFFGLRFIDGLFFEGIVAFVVKQDPQVDSEFTAIRNDLTSVYGNGKSYSHFKSPYRIGDGYESTAIKGGYGKLMHAWHEGRDINDDVDYILLETTPDIYLKITYRYAKLAKIAIQRAKNKASQDY